MENERKVLRWGGLAGISAFVIWIVDMPIYGIADPFIPEGLTRFPDVRGFLAINTILCMATALLSIAFVLVLYHVLRKTDQFPALIGGVFSIIGYIGIALGDASTFFAFDPLSNLYHAAGATPEAQANVILMWEATQGLVHTFAFLGSLFLMISFIALGAVMIGAPSFGRRFGCLSMAIGGLGIMGVVASLFVFEAIGAMFLADLVFLSIFGWKLYGLSRSTNPDIG